MVPKGFWVSYASVSHQQENTIAKCKQRLNTPRVQVTVQELQEWAGLCSTEVVSATPQTLPLPNQKNWTAKEKKNKTPQSQNRSVAWQPRCTVPSTQAFQLQHPGNHHHPVSSTDRPWWCYRRPLPLPGAVATPHMPAHPPNMVFSPDNSHP